MRFLFKRASSRTPAEAGQTPGRRTVNRQKAPRWGRGHGLVRFAAACFPALLALRLHTESIQRPLGEQRIHVPTPAHTCLTPSQGMGPAKRTSMGLEGPLGWGPWAEKS